MSRIRVLVGTRKGAFVLESDGKRERWNVSGPHFAGWEIYHVKGSPADANRLYASQSSACLHIDDVTRELAQPGLPKSRLNQRSGRMRMTTSFVAPFGRVASR